MGLVQHTFTWFSIDGAVAPTTGERFFLEWPHLNADTFQLFVDALAQAFPDRLHILLLDHSWAHTAQRIRWPAHVQAMWLPAYGSELNPIERLWHDVQDDLAWQHFADLDAPQVYVGDVSWASDASTLQALTGYAYVVKAVNMQSHRRCVTPAPS